MARSIFIFLALFVFVVHCHVLKDKESESSKKVEHKRQKRSCFVCDNNGNGPLSIPHTEHPPPPHFFRKWNWGMGTDSNGSQQSTFSKASLSADASTGSQRSGNDAEKIFEAGTASFSQNGAGASDGNRAGMDDTREALKGALKLAFQGAETEQDRNCNTCGKSNYAISNAKSDSGNAIAVSIGR